MRKLYFAIILTLSMCSVGFSQLPDTTYPRNMCQWWSAPPMPYFLLDRPVSMIITWLRDSLKIKNYIKPYKALTHIQTEDINAGYWLRNSIGGNFPSSWYLKTSSGENAYSYGGSYIVNPTDYCPEYTGYVNGSFGSYYVNEMRYNDAVIDMVNRFYNNSTWDGLGSDGTMISCSWMGSDIDIDNNGVNDYSEHNSTWINLQWTNGIRKIMTGMRIKAGSDYTYYWTKGNDTMYINYCNGAGFEGLYTANTPFVFSDYIKYANRWDTLGAGPKRTNLTYFCLAYDSSLFKAGLLPMGMKTYYRQARWYITHALMTNHWFFIRVADRPPAGVLVVSYTPLWYDEMESNLGKAKGKYQVISNGCYVRFFDNGCAILNPTNSIQTVSVSNISGLPGYGGPYYRIKGSQDTVTNNGKLFTSVTLVASQPHYRYYNGTTRNQWVGDGIVLKRSLDSTIIADLIIDNTENSTSPGQYPVYFYGSGGESFINNYSLFTYATSKSATPQTINPCFTMDRSDAYTSYAGWERARYAEAGTGNARAEFVFKVNVSGWYRIKVGYGWVGADSSTYLESSDAPYTIYHSDGVTTHYVNQRTGYRHWNVIDTVHFNVGGDNRVVLTNNTTTGKVVADVVAAEFIPPPVEAEGVKRFDGKK